MSAVVSAAIGAQVFERRYALEPADQLTHFGKPPRFLDTVHSNGLGQRAQRFDHGVVKIANAYLAHGSQIISVSD
jgi:hypothetical protein